MIEKKMTVMLAKTNPHIELRLYDILWKIRSFAVFLILTVFLKGYASNYLEFYIGESFSQVLL